MFQSSHSVPFQSKGYYGWYIVGIAALGIFFSGPGQTYSVSVFIDAYIREFGWGRSEVSSIYSVATLAAGLCMFFVGRFIDRFGQRNMLVAVSLLLGFACLWNSLVGNLVMLFIGFFLLRILGQGSMTLIPNTLVPQWFIVKRGKALSYMAIGGFASSAFFPVVNAWLLNEYGWRFSWLVWGAILIVLVAPLMLFFVRNKPEDIGLLPDNYVKSTSLKDDEKTNEIEEENWSLQEAMKTKAFWLILFCVSIPAIINTGITFHLISIFKWNDLSPGMAAVVLSLMALIGFPITLVAGRVLDRVKVNYVLAGIFLGEIIFMVFLLTTNTTMTAILFGVLWGISGGFERIALNYVWASYYGRESLGSIKGTATTVMVIGSAFGPLPFGYAFDFFHGYTEILVASTVLPLLGFTCAVIARKPNKQDLVMKG
ncbi:MFS transporter [Rossellomorea aquimaris]|uniref:Sugar phosphate permease n=1 Tax=Rossellomorea aquimaris TaxID=189382 RepID=A0A366EI72_9BACI|nr:MFS transporter [Rossellomorea aquimaris]RBP02053.1 sugar phosphate permease [Rossellomorea aquimaris]